MSTFTAATARVARELAQDMREQDSPLHNTPEAISNAMLCVLVEELERLQREEE